MVPSNCLKVKSFQLPKVSMPIIAVVGLKDEEGNYNEPTEMMLDYLQTLRQVQEISRPKINSVLQGLYGNDAELPFFRFEHFNTTEDLFAYTSADNYTFGDGNVGICYGF